jgi:hypothetical protein
MNTVPFKLERELHFRIRNQESTGKLFVGDITWLEERKKWACHWSLAHVHPELGRVYGDDPSGSNEHAGNCFAAMRRGRTELSDDRSNEAPAPNRRPPFPFGSPGEFEYLVGAPPASPAAVGEAQR